MNAREGYRLTAVGKGMPTGAKAQGIYDLADGTHTGTACCWDFGDVSTDPLVYTTMNTIFFGTGFWGKGAGSGPWFMGDFEGGVWADGASSPGHEQQRPVDEGPVRVRHREDGPAVGHVHPGGQRQTCPRPPA